MVPISNIQGAGGAGQYNKTNTTIADFYTTKPHTYNTHTHTLANSHMHTYLMLIMAIYSFVEVRSIIKDIILNKM